MRWTTLALAAALLAGTAACSDEPEARTAAGVPERWYTTVDEALADRPEVGTTAMLDNDGPCPLRKTVVLDGDTVQDRSDRGVVRLRGTIPAYTCSWYEDIPVEVMVAHAADAAGYAELVAGSRAVSQPGNVQTERDVATGGRTVHVVRTTYPTNPSAGFSLTAALLDEPARGRVTLTVDVADRIGGYDEQKVAEDLLATVDG